MFSPKQADLKLSKISMLVKGSQCIVNGLPLCGMAQKNTDEIDFVPPQMFLTEYDLDTCPSYTLPKVRANLIQSREDIMKYSMYMKSVYSIVWGKFILNHVEDLNSHKNKSRICGVLSQSSGRLRAGVLLSVVRRLRRRTIYSQYPPLFFRWPFTTLTATRRVS